MPVITRIMECLHCKRRIYDEVMVNDNHIALKTGDGKMVSHGFCNDACMAKVYGQELVNQMKQHKLQKEGGIV